MAVKTTWAKVRDINDIIHLNKIYHKENNFWIVPSKYGQHKLIKKSKYLTLVARDNEKLVGYLQSGLRNNKIHFWIEDIIVLKEFRRKGIAKLLVRKFVKHWNKRVENIVLITSDRNLKIFKKLGFRKEMNYMGYRFTKH